VAKEGSRGRGVYSDTVFQLMGEKASGRGVICLGWRGLGVRFFPGVWPAGRASRMGRRKKYVSGRRSGRGGFGTMTKEVDQPRAGSDEHKVSRRRVPDCIHSIHNKKRSMRNPGNLRLGIPSGTKHIN